jgi:hypothetical protein
LAILGIGGGIAYAIYVSLAKTYFIEIWLPPVAIVGGLTVALAFLKIHDLPFHLYLLYLTEFNLLPKKRIWTQGTGTPFISPFETIKKPEEPKIQLDRKSTKSLKELVNIVDNYGENAKKELEEKMKDHSNIQPTK